MRKLTTEEFINRANRVHKNVYDYSKVKYQTAHRKICIIDSMYGEFWQKPDNHLQGQGCPNRARTGPLPLTTDEFIEGARKIHGDLYDYSKTEYKGSHEKVCIIDPEYGEFWQTPSNHLLGNGRHGRANINTVHKDHIIPMAILGSRLRMDIDKTRPLYKFLNSPINLQEISGEENSKKCDWIEFNGKQIRARHVKNNYEIIAYLSEKLLSTNIDRIIEKDKLHCEN